ncbi:hypothetical protein CV102_15240 [Natronococcus pandeyae]|uniref:Uncharacterized protein n=1 Tax=Natronococcus pandeyae TaxID=2055836 RepID=A0A8J8TR80_9EURY|nr:hypothetical protein [Natronococcus pandeyae]TYL37690.1 hypothetical protein CV102_15240 [Natronococcus pandeyae]
MVGTETNSRDRGQIILIGAITLAFIILGIVVVFNGILYTEALSSGSSSQIATDVSTVEYELADGVGGIAHYENVEGNGKSLDDYEVNLTRYIDDPGGFDDQYRNSTANSRPVATNVSFNETVKDATVVTEDVEDGEIEDINSSIGHFELNLTPTTDKELAISAMPEDGDTTTVTITSDEDTFSVDGSNCDINGDQARFDLVAGDVDLRVEDNCDAEEVEYLEDNLSIIDRDKSYETIEISDEEDPTEGTFELVVKGDEELDPQGLIEETYYGAWSVTVDVAYDSHDASYERTQRISVYGGDE